MRHGIYRRVALVEILIVAQLCVQRGDQPPRGVRRVLLAEETFRVDHRFLRWTLEEAEKLVLVLHEVEFHEIRPEHLGVLGVGVTGILSIQAQPRLLQAPLHQLDDVLAFPIERVCPPVWVADLAHPLQSRLVQRLLVEFLHLSVPLRLLVSYAVSFVFWHLELLSIE